MNEQQIDECLDEVEERLSSPFVTKDEVRDLIQELKDIKPELDALARDIIRKRLYRYFPDKTDLIELVFADPAFTSDLTGLAWSYITDEEERGMSRDSLAWMVPFNHEGRNHA